MKNRYIYILLFYIFLFGLSGCGSTEEIYEQAKEYTTVSPETLELLVDGQLGVEVESPSIEGDVTVKSIGYVAMSGVSAYAKQYGWIIICVSIALGLLIMKLSGRATNIKKVGLFVFCLTIPIVTVLILYASSFLADAFK